MAKDHTIIASPVVDHIHDETFEYFSQHNRYLKIGGFSWDLKFKWIPIPESMKAKWNNPEPIKTPTISGGLFAINVEFFRHLRLYDDGLVMWGAENLELSFKAWMCGGSLEIVPCSHVGHLFRDKFPYDMHADIIKRNCMRLAEVSSFSCYYYYYPFFRLRYLCRCFTKKSIFY